MGMQSYGSAPVTPGLFELDEGEPVATAVRPSPAARPVSVEPAPLDDVPTTLFEQDDDRAPFDPGPPAPRPRTDPAPVVPAPVEAAVEPGREVATPTVTTPPVSTLPPEGHWCSALGVFDLETTGVDPRTARIVTAHVGLIDETGAVVERKEWVVDPGIEIPAPATAVHGVTTARARRFGRPPAEVVPEIVAAIRSVFARGFPVVIYNAPYDLTLLAAEAARWGVDPLGLPAPIVDPLVLDRELDRFRRGKRTLERAAAEYGVPLLDAHDAGADAVAAGRLAQAIAQRHTERMAIDASELHDRQIEWCRAWSAEFESYMRRERDPSFTASGAWPVRALD